MKQTTVLKALNSMDEKRVSEFLNDEFRNFGEIIEAVCDEVEVGYVDFMYELIQKCKSIEAEEQNKVVGNLCHKSGSLSDLIKSVGEDNLKLVVKTPMLTDEQSKKFYEVFKDYHPPIQFNLPKLDLTKYVVRRND